MKLLTVPQVQLAQLQSLTETLIRFIEPHEELTPHLTTVKELFVTFQEAIVKEDAVSNKRTLDRTRDLITYGMMQNVEVELLFPNQPNNRVKKLKEIEVVIEKYGPSIKKLPYDKQTAETDNMIKELEALDLSTVPNMVRWIEPLKTANENFKKGADDYLQDSVKSEAQASASAVSVDLINEINDLLTMLFAHVKVAKTDALKNSYADVTALIEQYS